MAKPGTVLSGKKKKRYRGMGRMIVGAGEPHFMSIAKIYQQLNQP